MKLANCRITPARLRKLHFNQSKYLSREPSGLWTLLGSNACIQYNSWLNEVTLTVDGIFPFTLSNNYKDLKKFIELNEQFEPPTKPERKKQ